MSTDSAFMSWRTGLMNGNNGQICACADLQVMCIPALRSWESLCGRPLLPNPFVPIIFLLCEMSPQSGLLNKTITWWDMLILHSGTLSHPSPSCTCDSGYKNWFSEYRFLKWSYSYWKYGYIISLFPPSNLSYPHPFCRCLSNTTCWVYHASWTCMLLELTTWD